MSALWYGLTALVLVAIVILLFPLLFQRKNKTQLAPEQANIIAYKERLAALELECNQGRLSPETLEQLKNELQAELLQDVPEHEASSQYDVRFALGARQYALIFVMALAVPATALGLYEQLGGSQQMTQFAAMKARQSMSLEELVADLQKRLSENPDNAKGWFMLAGSLLDMGRYQEAADALDHTLKTLPENAPVRASVMGQRAQALFFANDGKINAEVKSAIDETLKLNANEPSVMGVLGIAAYNQQLYSEAIGFWQRALAQNPQSGAANSLRQGIERAKQALGENTPAQTPQTAVVDESKNFTGVRVKVSLSPQAQSETNSNQIVFVLVRKVGERMPIAATRVEADRLPATITLDKRNSMTGQALENQGALEVVARVSKNANAIPQTGDWTGQVENIHLENGQQKQVELQIDHQFK
ncbi:c-type cytochrome biogenesis protein CcmI [Pokkaliibacter sp. CJK22405]|uniref:c-type cytochrome biogenesis protein CcmI n=1 Tax=Pokkaliibacter sp. CJK22405 TaxID=3384615 RepID=UPI003984B5D0